MQIDREAYRRALRERRAGSVTELWLANCFVLDTKSCRFSGPCNIHVVADKIAAVTKEALPKDCKFVDLKRRCYVIPGLCDAHIHCTASTANLPGLLSLPESLVTAQAALELEQMLARGFTTVRDAGGADFGIAQALDEGALVGPRLLFVGHALSQTGGHGDFRGKGEDTCACGAALRGIGRTCDGDAEVRKAARDELRKGAHCIKIMASGGVSSPTDRLTNTQFSEAEITAIVEEAAANKTYVCAHAYNSDAIARCLRCGVRSIEHGNLLDDPTAKLMKMRGAYLVPTLITYEKLVSEGAAAGLAQDLVDKVGTLLADGIKAVTLAHNHGIPVAFGSDLLGDMRKHQSQGLRVQAQACSPADVIRSATRTCASLFQMDGLIGEVAEGCFADLIVLDRDPLEDITVFERPEEFVAVMHNGVFVRKQAGL
ncbi:hypothetical protein WJX73_006150 [Symbiochloris irregularis]|uniref:Amidohydrolase-related domain-containing protein n=1 Tax=Symbiochloris irregularis TaxID=706552 RepID=A0AAW1NW51_9CHLO